MHEQVQHVDAHHLKVHLVYGPYDEIAQLDLANIQPVPLPTYIDCLLEALKA
ncbi:Uncharacterised protein [Acinetobacter baumannii]|nr:Uncharacterised protein [Acinetobacter baumannii]